MKNRIYGLDIVRATAILTVVYGHAFLDLGIPAMNGYRIGDGVSIFFVLSGFLIGKILLKMIHKASFSIGDLKNFWFRRWMRTLPAYFFVLTLLIIYQTATGSGHFSDYYHYYFFTQSFFYNGAALYPESWSLCIEEWFYLIMPILFFISFRFSKRALLVCIFLIIATSSTLSFIKAGATSGVDQWDVHVRQATITRFDSIMYGILGAYFSYYNMWKHRKSLFVVGLASYAAITFYNDLFGFTWVIKYLSLAIQSISVLLTLPFLENVKTGNGIIYRVMTFISIISYSMYLLCFTPFQIIHSKLSAYLGVNSIVFSFFLYIIVTFGGAYLMYRLIEKPFMSLRDVDTRKKRHDRINKNVPV